MPDCNNTPCPNCNFEGDKYTMTILPVRVSSNPSDVDSFMTTQINAAKSVWNKALIDFDQAAPQDITANNLVNPTSTIFQWGQALVSAIGSIPPDTILVFFVKHDTAPPFNYNGMTYNAGSSFAYVLINMNDAVATNNDYLLAHELGHVMNALHPGSVAEGSDVNFSIAVIQDPITLIPVWVDTTPPDSNTKVTNITDTITNTPISGKIIYDSNNQNNSIIQTLTIGAELEINTMPTWDQLTPKVQFALSRAGITQATYTPDAGDWTTARLISFAAFKGTTTTLDVDDYFSFLYDAYKANAGGSATANTWLVFLGNNFQPNALGSPNYSYVGYAEDLAFQVLVVDSDNFGASIDANAVSSLQSNSKIVMIGLKTWGPQANTVMEPLTPDSDLLMLSDCKALRHIHLNPAVKLNTTNVNGCFTPDSWIYIPNNSADAGHGVGSGSWYNTSYVWNLSTQQSGAWPIDGNWTPPAQGNTPYEPPYRYDDASLNTLHENCIYVCVKMPPASNPNANGGNGVSLKLPSNLTVRVFWPQSNGNSIIPYYLGIRSYTDPTNGNLNLGIAEETWRSADGTAAIFRLPYVFPPLIASGLNVHDCVMAVVETEYNDIEELDTATVAIQRGTQSSGWARFNTQWAQRNLNIKQTPNTP